jgi:hypothetical protein
MSHEKSFSRAYSVWRHPFDNFDSTCPLTYIVHFQTLLVKKPFYRAALTLSIRRCTPPT